MVKFDWEAIGTSFKTHRNKWLIAGLAVVLIGLTLFLTDWGSNWYFWRGVRKDKEAIKTEVNQLANIEKEIANLEVEREVQKERVKEAANGFAESINATDQQSAVIANAVNRMQEAANVNKGNVNAAEFDKLLEDLR